ncbi:hypothetical protein LWI29_038271 [Acer saccharum]|uniref:Uncharacterized protein n=1 Tax=Acer saccharum TaxID=4024 RepID=A0AA39W690_ACESA|nr:hypothetical protein LWI29_038271 [Acer saccharum]
MTLSSGPYVNSAGAHYPGTTTTTTTTTSAESIRASHLRTMTTMLAESTRANSDGELEYDDEIWDSSEVGSTMVLEVNGGVALMGNPANCIGVVQGQRQEELVMEAERARRRGEGL